MKHTIICLILLLLTFPVTLKSSQAQSIEAELNLIKKTIHSIFNVPEFDISIEPCGTKNAYSYVHNGDIVVCSELLNSYPEDQKAALFTVVLLHELGHSLLNLWGLPNYDNERTADEFATVFLLMFNGGEYTSGWISLFDNKINPYSETRDIILTEGQHPLTAQRANAVQKILLNPIPVIKRWNRVLYPHMTDQTLKAIIQKHHLMQGADEKLAKEILNNRN